MAGFIADFAQHNAFQQIEVSEAAYASCQGWTHTHMCKLIPLQKQTTVISIIAPGQGPSRSEGFIFNVARFCILDARKLEI